MNDDTNKRLWNPHLGIRFSPKTPLAPERLYPSLQSSRFLHLSNSRRDFPKDIGLPSDQKSHDVFYDCVSEFPLDESETGPAVTATGTSVQDPNSTIENFIDGDILDEDLVALLEKLPEEQKSNSEIAVEPPRTSLDFNISAQLFQQARTSANNSPGSYWSHTMYQKIGLDNSVKNVKVHYCTSRHSMEHVCKHHFSDESVLGFDLEWLAFANRGSGPRENISLIQMASPSRIGLFHVALFPGNDFVAPTFRSIMENPSISKVGVHIQADCTRLNNYLGVRTRGVFELSHLYKVIKYGSGKRPGLINKVPVALSTQVLDHLRLPLYKGQSVRSSNWMKPLTEAQMKYSASDAYAGLQLYHVLEEKRKSLSPCPPRPHHAELGLPIPILDSVDSDECDVVDFVESDSAEDTAIPTARSLPPHSNTRPKEPSARSQSEEIIDPRVVTATMQTKKYRYSKQTQVSVTPAALRAYYIWHDNADLTPANIASLLREPPLRTNTVVTYILEAILRESLPYSRKRLKEEVLSLTSIKLLSNSRYQALARDCQSSA